MNLVYSLRILPTPSMSVVQKKIQCQNGSEIMFFKKKKVLGTVTIFEENDIVAEDKFNDLVEDAENADELDIMTACQMKELAIANVRAGKEATARTLRVANEANQIGIDTAEKLHGQTEQLEKMGDDFVVVHDYLDKTERTLSPITSITLS